MKELYVIVFAKNGKVFVESGVDQEHIDFIIELGCTIVEKGSYKLC